MISISIVNKYKSLKSEQDRLSERMYTLLDNREKICSKILVDSVVGSDSEFPYIKRVTQVEGFSSNSDKCLLGLIEKELKLIREQQINNDIVLAEIRMMIEKMDDTYMKSILTYRVIYGLTWREVADKIGGCNSESAVKMAYKRYFEKQEK